MSRYFVLLLFFVVIEAGAARAQQQTFVFGGPIQISSDQRMMFEAVKQVMNRDYKGAEETYSRVIAINGNNVQAYLQRGIIRRELGNAQGAVSDGQSVVTMSNSALQNAPNDANLYYQRGMGFRLIKNYDQAKNDVHKAMQLGGQQAWETDLRAIEFEQKEMR